MVRNVVHRWLTKIYCIKCAKPEIEELLQSSIESFNMFKVYKSDDPSSAYMMFKGNVEHYENILKTINEELKYELDIQKCPECGYDNEFRGEDELKCRNKNCTMTIVYEDVVSKGDNNE